MTSQSYKPYIIAALSPRAQRVPTSLGVGLPETGSLKLRRSFSSLRLRLSSKLLTAALGSNFAGSSEPISPGVSRISLSVQADNFALLRAPGFEYELALAFLRRDRPGSKEPPLRGDEKRTGVRMKTGT